jgi:hypothetical protein
MPTCCVIPAAATHPGVLPSVAVGDEPDLDGAGASGGGVFAEDVGVAGTGSERPQAVRNEN